MQAILHHRLKKPPPHLSWPSHILISVNTLWGRWMLSNNNHTTSVFWRTASKKRTKKKKEIVWWMFSYLVCFFKVSRLFFLSSPPFPPVFVLYEKEESRAMKEEEIGWKASRCYFSIFPGEIFRKAGWSLQKQGWARQIFSAPCYIITEESERQGKQKDLFVKLLTKTWLAPRAIISSVELGENKWLSACQSVFLVEYLISSCNNLSPSVDWLDSVASFLPYCWLIELQIRQT